MNLDEIKATIKALRFLANDYPKSEMVRDLSLFDKAANSIDALIEAYEAKCKEVEQISLEFADAKANEQFAIAENIRLRAELEETQKAAKEAIKLADETAIKYESAVKIMQVMTVATQRMEKELCMTCKAVRAILLRAGYQSTGNGCNCRDCEWGGTGKVGQTMFNLKIKLKTTTAIYCPYCHSPLVEHGKPVVREDLIAHNELYAVQCRKCGAKGNIRESWPLQKAVQAKESSPEKEGW